MKSKIIQLNFLLRSSIFTLAILFLTGISVNAQVLLDAHSDAAGASTWNITTTQPNELILISAGGYGTLSTAAGTVTVNGNNATYINEAVYTNGFSFTTSIWAYVAPTVGTYTLVCSEVGQVSPFYFNYAACVYEPAATLTLANITASTINDNAALTNISASITTTVANSYIYGYVIINDNGGTGVVSWNGGLTELDHDYISNGIDGSHAGLTEAVAAPYTINVTDPGASNPYAVITLIVVQPSATCTLTASMGTPTDDLCNGGNNGSATVTASGGVAPYTYLWSPAGGTNATGTGLTAGNYTVTVTDFQGCTGTASVTITQPTPVTISIASQTPVVCSVLGSATANPASGGTSPYTYSWSPSGGTNLTASNLSAGTYTITATDNHGCIGSASVTITQAPSPVSVTIASQTNVTCTSLGSATANPATGGSSPYTYSWAPSGGTNLTASNLSAGTYTITARDNNGCSGTASVTITQAASSVAITIASHSDVTCSTLGSATANPASGGVAPYTYLWSPSGGTNLTASNLSAGTYTITATDNNGCTGSVSVTISQTTSPVSVSIASQTNVSCNTLGSATANPASGGTSPYTYLWSPSGGTNLMASNLSAGTYTITATDNNGCSGTASVIISQSSSSVSITIASKTTLLCDGFGYITAHAATGGTPPYTYLWTPSGGTNLATTTNLTAGTYTITATDSNGCSGTASETISYPSHLSVSATVTGNLNCYGGHDATVSCTASGGTPAYTYYWFPSGGKNSVESGLSGGTYIITVTDSSGCTATAEVTISEPAGMNIKTDSIDVHGSGGCNGQASVTVLSGGAPPYTYKWIAGGQTTDTINNQCTGDYCCIVTDNNGCSQTTCIIIRSTVGIDNLFGNSTDITIFPDPNNGIFTIKGIERGMVLEMYDYLGRNINTVKVTDESMQMNIASQPNGIYLIRILTNDGTLVDQLKMVKTR